MNDIFFSDSFTSYYNQIFLRHNDYIIPFSVIDFNGIRSLISIGYQGPVKITSPENIDFLMSFAEKENICTAFIRYNPLFENHLLIGDLPIEDKSFCYITDFRNMELYLNSRPMRLKTILRKKPPEYDCLYSVNSPINAALQYKNEFFSNKNDVKTIIESGLAILINAKRNNQYTASSMFLESGNSAVYIANASNNEGREFGDNAFLLIEYMKQALERNIYILYLGGGIGGNDSLDIFKKQFATQKKPIYHTKLVFNKTIFNKYSAENRYFPPWLFNVSITDLIQGKQKQ